MNISCATRLLVGTAIVFTVPPLASAGEYKYTVDIYSGVKIEAMTIALHEWRKFDKITQVGDRNIVMVNHDYGDYLIYTVYICDKRCSAEKTSSPEWERTFGVEIDAKTMTINASGYGRH